MKAIRVCFLTAQGSVPESGRKYGFADQEATMTTIVVGMMTYVVDNPVAADVLREAAAADRCGNFEEALTLKRVAARIECGTARGEDWAVLSQRLAV